MSESCVVVMIVFRSVSDHDVFGGGGVSKCVAGDVLLRSLESRILVLCCGVMMVMCVV